MWWARMAVVKGPKFKRINVEWTCTIVQNGFRDIFATYQQLRNKYCPVVLFQSCLFLAHLLPPCEHL